MDTLQDLQEQERKCIAKFRAKAAQLRAQDARLSPSIAAAMAYESLPRTMNTYLSVRSRLALAGIAALPLR